MYNVPSSNTTNEEFKPKIQLVSKIILFTGYFGDFVPFCISYLFVLCVFGGFLWSIYFRTRTLFIERVLGVGSCVGNEY